MTGAATPSIRRASRVLLQVVVVLVAIGAAALMLWEPHVEGRNAHATTFQIYLNDPFLIYAYVASIALVVFVGAYEVYAFVVVRGTDDIAGGVAIGLFMICVVAAAAAVVFERVLQTAVDMKSENDLTV